MKRLMVTTFILGSLVMSSSAFSAGLRDGEPLSFGSKGSKGRDLSSEKVEPAKNNDSKREVIQKEQKNEEPRRPYHFPGRSEP